jgi:hypothetical protein
MAHYKKDAASNRNALFGGGGGSSGGRSVPRTSRTQQTTQKTTSNIARNIPPTSTLPSLTSSTNNTTNNDPTITPGPSTIFTTHGRLASKGVMSLLSGQAKIDKMAEAEDYRLKVCL